MRKGHYYDRNDYEIMETGEIINRHNNHIVKPQKNGKGYLRVSIGGKLEFVHRLVAQQYVPNPENKHQVNHIDGNKMNNNASNLEWVSNQENRFHAIDNNLIIKGEACPWAKLTNEDVNYIRSHTELRNIDLAEKYGISQSTISGIRCNRTWKN